MERSREKDTQREAEWSGEVDGEQIGAKIASRRVVARMSHCPAPPEPSQWDDYENVPSPGTECGFVTNDIYETCRGRSQTGWVENEIYG